MVVWGWLTDAWGFFPTNSSIRESPSFSCQWPHPRSLQQRWKRKMGLSQSFLGNRKRKEKRGKSLRKEENVAGKKEAIQVNWGCGVLWEGGGERRHCSSFKNSRWGRLHDSPNIPKLPRQERVGNSTTWSQVWLAVRTRDDGEKGVSVHVLFAYDE